MAHQVLLGAQARLEQLQRQCDEAFTAYEANPNNEFKKKRYEELISSLHKAEDVMQSLATAAGAASWCKLVLQVPQVLPPTRLPPPLLRRLYLTQWRCC